MIYVVQSILRGLSFIQIHFNQFKLTHYYIDSLNHLLNIKIYNHYDNTLEDEDSNLFIVFIGSSVLCATKYIFESY